MSDFIDKAKETVSDAVDSVADSSVVKKAEDMVEEKAEEGGTVGSIADKADDAIDSVQGTKD
jgi:hypothetical protein